MDNLKPLHTIINLCNSGTPKLSGEFLSLFSLKELERVKEANNAVYLIYIHLDWDGRALSSDYGFDVANWMRTRGFLSPIIFYSFIQQEYFEFKATTSLKHKLLFGRGSAFLEAPFTEAQLDAAIDDLPKLSPSSLHDLVTMLADVKGLVLDRLNHDLKFCKDVLAPFREVEPFLSATQKSLIDFNNFRDQLVQLSAGDDEMTFLKIKETFLSICHVRLTEAGKDVAAVISPHTYKILVLEDAEDDLEKSVRNLGEYFSVVSTRDAQQAIDYLEADISNEILAVVSDWRLYRPNAPSYWQKYQGYEVLEKAAHTGHRALFALTSQADFVVHHIRNSMGIKFNLVKKQNLESRKDWGLLSDLIHNGCADALLIISQMPSSTSWHKPTKGVSYKMLYLQMMNSLEATEFFTSVENKADEIWDYLVLKSKDNYKGVGLLKDIYGLEIPKKNLDLSIMLTMRLVWLALWYSLDKDVDGKDRDEVSKLLEKVYKIVCTGNYGYDFQGNDNVEMNKLCLKIKDIQQKKLLPHERAWLMQKNLIG